MGAAVHQDVNLAVFVAGQDRRLCSDSEGLVVAGLGHFAVMPDEDPIVFENAIHLELEDFLIDIDSSMHPRFLNQFLEIQLRGHRLSPPPGTATGITACSRV
jgi:hypothetical protein